ncbi:MAG: glycosyltransferase family 2 protein [Bacteroidota bacterium]
MSFFSVCIPNFNYRAYLQLACESVLAQDFTDYELVIADNNSTDGSREYITNLASRHSCVRYVINTCNLGFAGNLDKVTSLATGNHFILLSSDDLMNAGSLRVYKKLIGAVGSRAVIGSSVFRIDGQGKVTDRSLPDVRYWRPGDQHAELSALVGKPVYRVSAREMLQRCFKYMGNPYYFLSVCYPSSLYQQVGGYGGGRLYGPDKWFNWKLFAVADYVYLVDEPLFSYRWHTQNQAALEASSGHLKYLTDEYRNTMEVTDAMLSVAGITRVQFERNFVRCDIFKHGLGEYLKGRWTKSMRILFFGLSCYPGYLLTHPLILVYVFALLSTPVGARLARFIYLRK